MNSNHPFDLVIGLDRSDRKADLHLTEPRTGKAQKQTVAASPEAFQDWLAQLRQQYPQAHVAICLEQPAANLILFLETYSWITLYPINPITLQKFRETFVTSRAKDDDKDAEYLAELLLTHHGKLKAWQPDDSQTRQLQQLVSHRRAVVDERTGLSNRLKALLKQYFLKPWNCAVRISGVPWPLAFCSNGRPCKACRRRAKNRSTNSITSTAPAVRSSLSNGWRPSAKRCP
jgi:transposase